MTSLWSWYPSVHYERCCIMMCGLVFMCHSYRVIAIHVYIDDLVWDCGIPSALTIKVLQSCTEPSIYPGFEWFTDQTCGTCAVHSHYVTQPIFSRHELNCPTFCCQHFQWFLDGFFYILYFDRNFLVICYNGFVWQLVIISSGNGRGPNRQ